MGFNAFITVKTDYIRQECRLKERESSGPQLITLTYQKFISGVKATS